MSLDVSLVIKGTKNPSYGPKIFIREGGQTKEISREEWDNKYPGVQPVVHTPTEENYGVFGGNITHNLGKMAHAAGLYQVLWRPEEINFTKAHQLIPILKEGVLELLMEPDKYKEFNHENGWGTYESLVQFVIDYLRACKKYPEAEVEVSR